MMRQHDPLADPAPLIRRIYGYVAYRLGEGPDAEDVTSEVFARALRYKETYDPRRGEPTAWLIGIARRCVDDALSAASESRSAAAVPEVGSSGDLEWAAAQRLDVVRALKDLDPRARDLIALRYGADMSARQIGGVLEMKPNAVDVALHRALARLRVILDEGAQPAASDAATEASTA